jgi:AcrR family transcriptional regulator
MRPTDDIPQPPWVSDRKPRGAARTPLSRDAIVEAALRVVDRAGVDGATMRRVAEELGTSPSALYWHVRNRHELLQFVFDRVAGEVALPEPDPTHWQEQLKTVGRELRRVLTSHRDIARVSIASIPVGTNVLQISEWLHALLRGAGLPDRVVALVGDLLGLFVGAFAYEESIGLASPTGEDLPPEQILAMLGEYWASLPKERFPHTLALLPVLFEGGPDERYEFMMDVIIRGIASVASEG